MSFPGYDAALDIDLPAARAGTIHTMSRTNNLVVLPALAIAFFPAAILIGGDAVSAGKYFCPSLKEHKSIQKVTHILAIRCRRFAS